MSIRSAARVLRNMFRNLRSRRFRIERARKYDVLILQDTEAEFLMECIPKGATTRICAIGEELPIFLSIAYFIDVISSIATGIRAGPAVLRAAVKIWDPSVVLSGETITDLPGEVSEFFPEKRFIVISRCVLAAPLLPRKLPIFYSYGFYDKDILDQVGCTYAEHHPIGSLKAALIQKAFRNKENRFDLCFISQYRDVIADRNLAAAPQGMESFFIELFDTYNQANALAYEYVCRLAEKRGMSLCVAMSSSHADAGLQAKERKYFRSFLRTEYEPVFIPKTGRSSYDAVLSSRLSVTLDSSLGYEALGLRKKVLFFVQTPVMHRYYQRQFKNANPDYYSRLPSELKLMSEDFGEFEDKATRVMALGRQEYQELTKEARAYYMNNSDTAPPDEILRSRILSALNGKSIPKSRESCATS